MDNLVTIELKETQCILLRAILDGYIEYSKHEVGYVGEHEKELYNDINKAFKKHFEPLDYPVMITQHLDLYESEEKK